MAPDKQLFFRLFALLIVLVSTGGELVAQRANPPGSHADRVVPLHTNPVLTSLARKKSQTIKVHKITPPPQNPIKTVGLPFLDDFAKSGPYPNPKLWQNNNVFVNNSYPICPHTLGVATFDGVNSIGMPYNPGCPLNGSYPADTLTSQLIALYAACPTHSPADSVYFSFYWQAGGLGDPPKPNDTLVLEFFNGSVWNEVWYHLGYTPQPPDTGFHLVMIALDSSEYFINGFQFRFRSYANTSGNLDHWHIDEVYLNYNRSHADTAQFAVSFVYECPSLLKNYQFEPWEQFEPGDLKSSITSPNRNNDTVTINTTYTAYVTPAGFMTPYNGGAQNATPFYITGYMNYNPFTAPSYSYTAAPLSGPITYDLTQVLVTTPSYRDGSIDTLQFKQIFSNYYAYDDGTAEGAYMVNGNNNPVQLAEQFTLNNPDTLTGVYIFFSYVMTNTTGYTFLLTLWNNAGGMPGSIIYENDSIYNPVFPDSLDEFVYYKFNNPQPIPANTPVYIGLTQTFGDSINIGWDWNNNNQYKVFYNIGLGWNFSSYPGSLMLRPVFGKHNFNAVQEVQNASSSLMLYPNPAQNEVYLNMPMLPGTLLRIYGADGRLWLEDKNFSGNKLDVAGLPRGFYFLQFTPQDGVPMSFKLVRL